MPFREKIAWLSLIAIVISFGLYFCGLLFTPRAAQGIPMMSFIALVGAVVLLTIIMVIGAIVAAVQSPSEASAPADERDRLVAASAARIAYPVLITLVLLAGVSWHFGHGVVFMLNALLGAIVIAELVRCALEIRGYRRG